MAQISAELLGMPVDGVNLETGPNGTTFGDQLPAGQAVLLVFLRHLG